MEKSKYRGILVVLFVLSALLLTMSISAVSAEDVINPDSNVTVENETSLEDHSNVKIGDKPVKVSQNSVIVSAKNLKAFADKNKRLPDYISVNGYKLSMPEFFYLMSKTISAKGKKSTAAITVKYDLKNPSKASGAWVRGDIYSYYYCQYANKIITHMDKNKKAPNFIKTAGGSKLQYQSNVYLFAAALSGTKTKLPYYVKIDMKSAHPINKYLPKYNRNKPVGELIGSGNLGYVQLIGPFGNVSSKIKIAYIIGMHPLESNSHNAVYKTLSEMKNAKYAYYVYKITVTKNAGDYYLGRMNGQLIAQKYVLPNIKLNKYKLVIDVHSNRDKAHGGAYEKSNFIFAPLNSASSKTVANKLIKQISGLSYYYPKSQTSPPYCTEPIVKSGTKTLVYETSLNEASALTLKYIKQLVNRVDKLSL